MNTKRLHQFGIRATVREDGSPAFIDIETGQLWPVGRAHDLGFADAGEAWIAWGDLARLDSEPGKVHEKCLVGFWDWARERPVVLHKTAACAICGRPLHSDEKIRNVQILRTSPWSEDRWGNETAWGVILDVLGEEDEE